MKRYNVILLSMTVALIAAGCGNNNKILNKGVKALEKENYSAAVESFEEMIKAESEEKPKNDKQEKIQSNNLSEAYKGLGVAYFELKEYDKALDSYVKCDGLEGTKTPSMYRNMAICANEINEYSSAAEYAEKGIDVIKEDEESAEPEIKKELYFLLIQSLEKDGNWEEALSWAEGYSEMFPDDKDVEKEIEFLKTR